MPLEYVYIVFQIIAFLFAISVHESAHAWMANLRGDPTARMLGRITLNPIKHIDAVGSVLLPAIGLFSPAHTLFGWAKPTPVNPLRWRNKRVANFWVSAAGVICNFIIAVIAGVIIRVLYSVGIIGIVNGSLAPATTDSMIAVGAVDLLWGFFTLNVALGVFNLIPIPPLDGSKVLQSILPPSFEPGFEALERFGFLLLIVAMFTGVFRVIFSFVMPLAITILFLGAS